MTPHDDRSRPRDAGLDLTRFLPALGALAVLACAQAPDPTGAPALDARAQTIDALLDQRARNRDFSGVLWIAVDGEPVLRGAYGFADFEQAAPMGEDGVFRVGSLTKPITASTVVLTAQAGLLSLDDGIRDLVEGCPASWSAVTVRHLLTHTSGIVDHFGDLDAVPVEATAGELERVLATLPTDEPLLAIPGEVYAYSNFNYVLLGVALERAHGRPWPEVLERLVLAPLGMTDTGYDDVWALVPDRVRGYGRDDRGAVRNIAYDDHAAYAAGGLRSTARDLLTFANAVFSGDLLGADTDAALTPFRDRYGYGWQIRELFGRPMVNHSGGIDGFSSHLAHYPDDGLTIVALSNVEADSAMLVACDVAALWFEWPRAEGEPADRLELPPRRRCGLPDVD